MVEKIKTGTILIKEGSILPGSLRFESEPYSNGWRSVKDLDGYGLDRKIREAGWTFFYMAGEVNAMVVGFDVEKTTRRAIKRMAAKLKSDKFNFNSLEITQVAAKRFLGLRYVTVSAHQRHIQESMFLFHSEQLAEGDPANAACRPNLNMWLAREVTVSERNGDKARFGRERRGKILRRKRTEELRKALETKQPSATSTGSPGR